MRIVIGKRERGGTEWQKQHPPAYSPSSCRREWQGNARIPPISYPLPRKRHSIWPWTFPAASSPSTWSPTTPSAPCPCSWLPSCWADRRVRKSISCPPKPHEKSPETINPYPQKLPLICRSHTLQQIKQQEKLRFAGRREKRGCCFFVFLLLQSSSTKRRLGLRSF